MKEIIKQKSRFFLTRIVIYFSFLLIPIWIQRVVVLNRASQFVIVLCYIMFMLGQWYLMGKEIDHRLKIYFRANSSLDRLLSRIFLGNVAFLIIFNLMSLIPWDYVKHFYWGLWISIGLYYSWPTRGKIIQESMSTQFVEYKYLDSIERLIIFLSILLLVISIPNFPRFDNVHTLQLVFDPEEKVHDFIWTFLKINYFPFWKNAQLYSMAWSMHIYFVGMFLYIMSFYSIARMIISRRLAILGIFSILSSWSISKITSNDYLSPFVSVFPILWAWGIMWAAKSSTYRAGFLLGLICFWGSLIGRVNVLLFPISMIIEMFLLKEKTPWYKRQTLKYMLVGVVFSSISFIAGHEGSSSLVFENPINTIKEYLNFLDQKSFFTISIIGLLLLVLIFGNKFSSFFMKKNWPVFSIKELTIVFIIMDIFGYLFNFSFVNGFPLLVKLSLLSLLPLELLFLKINKWRSQRNLIFFAYLLICLLDSHIEGRVKIILKFLT